MFELFLTAICGCECLFFDVLLSGILSKKKKKKKGMSVQKMIGE